MHRYLVFDLDGTLVDSLPGIAEGVNRALASLGRPRHTPEAVRGMIGRGAANLCAAAIGYADASLAPAEELAPMQQAFAREYAHCWQGNFTRPYPGVREMLLALAGQGARLAVLSNKPHEVTLPMVRSLFPEVPFDPIFGFTGRFPRKPDPAALRCIAEGWGVALPQLVMVGDSRYDALTAENAGCGLLLLSWGYGGDLSRWGSAVVPSAAAALERLLGGGKPE